jgi:hypothetical protein
MQSTASTPEEYIEALPKARKEAMKHLRQTLLNHLPEGFEEQMCYGMLGYVVPHSRYPDGYHCDPSQPLPFINIASQKNHIALYHSGIYSKPELLAWFQTEWPQYSTYKLDMGKSCIRFKNPDTIPLDLIAQLATKMTVQEWIETYEAAIKK